MTEMNTIAVVGDGALALATAALLAQHNKVELVLHDAAKAEQLGSKTLPIKEQALREFLEREPLNLAAGADLAACQKAAWVVLCPETEDAEGGANLNLAAMETAAAAALKQNPNATVVVKAAVPVGYTLELRAKNDYAAVLCSPDFSRKGFELTDNLTPSRIVVGAPLYDDDLVARANAFAALLGQATRDETPRMVMDPSEAEAVKLFDNAYLALRVSFFNELDTYAELRGLDTARIIDGVCADPRVGTRYNNPSFGFGGDTLAKDVKKLLSGCDDVPENLLKAVAGANRTRKFFIVERALKKAGYYESDAAGCGYAAGGDVTAGIYRLNAKSGSASLAGSAAQDILQGLKAKGAEIYIYEPALENGSTVFGCKVLNDLAEFKKRCDIILANRYDAAQLDDVKKKVYTRDVFARD